MKSFIKIFFLIFLLGFISSELLTGQNISLPVELMPQNGHNGNIFSEGIKDIEVLENENLLFTSSGDHTIRVWEYDTGNLIRIFKGHTAQVNNITILPDKNHFVSGSGDKMAKVWNILDSRPITSYQPHKENAVVTTDCAIKADIIGIAYYSGIVFFTSRSLSDPISKVKVPSGIKSFSISHDGSMYAYCTWNGRMCIKETRTNKTINCQQYFAVCEDIKFSADDKLIYFANANIIFVYEIASGKKINEIKFPKRVTQFDLNESGSLVVANCKTWKDGVTVVANLDNNEVKVVIKDTNNDPTSIKLSEINKEVIIGYSNGDLKIFNVKDGKFQRNVSGDLKTFNHLVSHHSGNLFFGGEMNGRIDTIYNYVHIDKMYRQKKISGINISNDSTFFGSCGYDSTLVIIDYTNGKEIFKYKNTDERFKSLAISNTGMVYTGDWKGNLRKIEFNSGQVEASVKVHNYGLKNIGISSNGLILVDAWHKAILFDQNLRKVNQYHFPGLLTNSVEISSDGKYSIVGFHDGTVGIWNNEDKKEKYRKRYHHTNVTSIFFSKSGRYFVSCSEDNSAFLWDVEKADTVKNLEGHYSGVLSGCFINNDEIIVTCSFDGSVNYWNIKTGKLLFRIFYFSQNDFAVISPEGLFDASPGAMKKMHFVKGLEVIELNQIKDKYWEPGLLQKLLGYNAEPIRPSKGLDDIPFFPEIDYGFEENENGTDQLVVKLKSRGGGIGDVKILINGKEVPDLPVSEVKGKEEGTLKYPIKGHPLLIPGDNEVEVIAYNEEGNLKSRGPKKVYSSSGINPQPSKFFAIIAGTADYKGDQIDLQFSGKDAQDMANAVRMGGNRLFGENNTDVKVFSTENDSQNEWPTKENIRNAFFEVSKLANSNDILLIYLSGHGVNYQFSVNEFFYLTSSANSTDLRDDEYRNSVAISSDTLMEWIKSIPALNQVLILDACASGQFAKDLNNRSFFTNSSSIRAYERIKDWTGTYVLAGSAADAESFETSKYDQGILTYSLLSGMKGSALQDQKYVEVLELFNYARKTVPQLAAGEGGIQQPEIRIPLQAKSLKIGELTTYDRENISVKSAKPIFTKTELRNANTFVDELDLSRLMNDKLRELYNSGKGPIIFDQTDTRDDAFSIKGSYTIEDNLIKINCILFLGINKESAIKFEANSKDEVIEKLDFFMKSSL